MAAKFRLTIDIGPLFEDQWTGIPVFTRRLVQSLKLVDKIELSFSHRLTAVPNDWIDNAIALASGTYLREAYHARAASEAKRADIDTAFLYPSVKGRFSVSSCEASTVHDMSTLVMPENHVEPNIAHHLDHLAFELKSNSATFCASEATRSALVSAYPSALSTARVLYQYADWPEDFALLDYNSPPINLGSYAAVIGTIEPRKNLGLLLEALKRPEFEAAQIKFVVIGKKGWLVDKFLEGLTSSQRERIIFSGFVSEFVKYRILKNAEFLIFPSIYEGFGIPALEAMSLGKPVLAARTSSFLEVVGDGGLYFDPFSVEEFSEAFLYISRPKVREVLSPKAIKQSGFFGPARMAEGVMSWLNNMS